MKNLQTTAAGFMRENFGVKISSHQFNQVPTDQATEQGNRMCKFSNKMESWSITRNDPTRENSVQCIAKEQQSGDVLRLFGLEHDNEDEHVDIRRREMIDHEKNDYLFWQLTICIKDTHHVFHSDQNNDCCSM